MSARLIENVLVPFVISVPLVGSVFSAITSPTGTMFRAIAAAIGTVAAGQ